MLAMTAQDILKQLEAMGDPARRRHNARVGPDGIPGVPEDLQYGVKTGDLRKLDKTIKGPGRHDLGLELWATGNLDAQMLAILLVDAASLSLDDLDSMVRDGRFSWVADWLQAYVIAKRTPKDRAHLRDRWMRDPDAWAARAGWHLAASMVAKSDGDPAPALDPAALLDRIEREMPTARPETRWTMNNTLAAIGIHCPPLRDRAVAIGQRIGLYKDWPVSKGCTPPYVPVWVQKMAPAS